MRTKQFTVGCLLALLMATSANATQYWYPELFPRRVGVVNAIHDFWHEPNLTAANDLGGLGIKAIKLWPTEHHLSSNMQQIYQDPRFDVIAIRPLNNSQQVTEIGCDGKQYTYYRWENIDYGQVALDLYQNFGHLDKTIILTGWEGDNQIKGLGCGNRVPSQAEIDSYRQLLEVREAGIRAAQNAYPNANLWVVHAIEVNHVLGTSFRIIDEIIPNMSPQPHLISYSHWSVTYSITQTIDHIASVISPLPRHRIIIGEVGRTERPCCSQYPSLYDSYSEAYNAGSNLVFMWNYRDQFACPTDQGRWLRRCDDSLATSYDALMDLKAAFETP